MGHSILVVDDEKGVIRSLEGILLDEGYEVISALSGDEALAKAEEHSPDLVLLDIWMPGLDGIEVLQRLKAAHPRLEVIMMTGHGNIETAVKSIKLGAYDFIEKPLDYEKLLLSISRALEHQSLKDELQILRSREDKRAQIIGNSPSIQRLLDQIHAVAPTDAWVLIQGENGTGKELVALTIHRLSRRANRPWVDVNCAAIPEELIESELFGHEKGAFTGATATRRGKFDLANTGTLFLDEIGDLSLKAQAKILRILQEQTFTRVGGTKIIKVDVRVLAATNKDLEREMEEGRFRKDLFYRLNVIPIHVPPLRERYQDIPQLVEAFQKDLSQRTGLPPKEYSKEAMELLQSYNWPGNVRELKNLVERLMIMNTRPTILPSDVPAPYNPGQKTVKAMDYLDLPTLREAKERLEKAYIENKLRQTNWNITLAAEQMGIERSNLYRKIKQYGITPSNSQS